MNLKIKKKFVIVLVIMLLVGFCAYYYYGWSEKKKSVENQVQSLLQDTVFYGVLDSLSKKQSDITSTQIQNIVETQINKDHPARIIGIIGRVVTPYNDSSNIGNASESKPTRSDTTQTMFYWASEFKPVIEKEILDSVMQRRLHFNGSDNLSPPLNDNNYINRVPPGESRAYDILMTDAKSFDDNLYLSLVFIKICLPHDNSNISGSCGKGKTLDWALVVCYPLQSQPAITTNLIFLVFIVIILLIINIRGRTVNKYFNKYFLIATSCMVFVFIGLLLPTLFPNLLPHFKFIVSLLRLLPDDAFFLLAGLSLFYHWDNIPLRLIIATIVLHLTMHIWEMKYVFPIFIDSADSIVFLPDRIWRLFPPQVFAFVALSSIGLGIFKNGKKMLESLQENLPSSGYVWLFLTFSCFFFIYGPVQLYYPFATEAVFFNLVLIAKILTFSGVILFINMYVVMKRVEGQHLVAEAIIDASPDPMIVFNDEGRIKFFSEAGLQPLNMEKENIPEFLTEVLYDHREWQYLCNLVKSYTKRDDFHLMFKSIDDKRIDYLASYVPIQKSELHLLSIRLLHQAMYEEKIGSIQSHSMKGKAKLILNYLDLFLKDKSLYGFRIEDEDPRIIGMKKQLGEMRDYMDAIDKIKGEYSGSREEIHNVAYLTNVFQRIKISEKNAYYNSINITYPDASSYKDVYVRHDEDILYEDIKELLTNSNTKFIPSATKGEVNISCTLLDDGSNKVEIMLEDNGDPIDENNAKYKKFLVSSPSFFTRRKRGLESIKSNMNLFGGEIICSNEKHNDKLITTFKLILWKVVV